MDGGSSLEWSAPSVNEFPPLVPAPNWNDLAERPQLQFEALGSRAALSELAASYRARSRDRGEKMDSSLSESWSELAEESLDVGAARATWASESTLLTAAPTAVGQREFLSIGRRAAQAQGASLQVPIYPAGGPADHHWAVYRDWFRAASALDGGELQACAFCNPALAVRGAIRLARHGIEFVYTDSSHTLEVTHAGHVLEINAEMTAFMSLINGLLPEHVLAAAVDEALARLSRLEQLRDEAETRIGAQAVRFLDETPVFLVGERVVVDSQGEAFFAGGALSKNHGELLARAATAAFGTSCTCDAPRRVQRALVTRGEVYSFGSDVEPVDYFFTPVGDSHCAVYELSCPHAVRRPSVTEWTEGGWTPERCENEWVERPLAGELVVAETSGWLSHAAVAWGSEVGALVTSKPLLSAVGRATGFPLGRLVTVYVPNANVMFLTDEEMEGMAALREAFERGALVQLLQDEGLPLGAEVDLLTRVRLEAAPGLNVPVRRLAFEGAWPGELA